MRRKLIASLIGAMALLGIVAAIQVQPASASACAGAASNPYGIEPQVVQVQSNGLAAACVVVVITHTCPWPQQCPFWFTWYVQEMIDPYYPDSAGCAKMQYRKEFVAWINTPYPQGYDCNSVDSTPSSGYMLIDPSYGGSGYDPKFQTRVQLANGAVGSITEHHILP